MILLSYNQKEMVGEGLFESYLLHVLFDKLHAIECFVEPGESPIQGEALKNKEQINRDLEVTPMLTAGRLVDV